MKEIWFYLQQISFLSTPYGTLGTRSSLQVQKWSWGILSTPYGTLGTARLGCRVPHFKVLSTPYGTLGTYLSLEAWCAFRPFNSIRYIRNCFLVYLVPLQSVVLSTPYGTLGTLLSFENLEEAIDYLLSTPYGTLGTGIEAWDKLDVEETFNSIRYIRNPNHSPNSPKVVKLSTPYGTLGTYLFRNSLFNSFILSTPYGTLGTILIG